MNTLADTAAAAAIDQSFADAVDAASVVDTQDRRRSDRVTQSVPGWISGESADRGATGRTITINDLSMHGVGFYDRSTAYRPGAAHWLIVNGGALRLSTRVKIVSCRPNAERGGYDIGARFF